MSDKEAAPAEAPKKSKKMLMIIVIALVVLGGGGAGAFFMLNGDSAEAKAPEPVKGAVAAMENAITINLSDGHFLKMGFTLQLTADAGTEAPDLSEAIDLAIDQYTGMEIAELETEKGREKAKAELLEKIEEAYYEEEEKKQIVMGIYFTQFVTQ
jgi:flagellar protein FliL